ncbi:TonB-dependent receptor [Hansschlegelia zhihuaiae]|uniref:TonB-dependent siderophore receptor n=1 Tax=Hansschlegelia zhihuaiae TaxID=405005 RepID=A0A4Q0MHC9_9HYPH|nr:TonB-dependent siderophore receptor [Hansschlegelia zhihuaiae]RXF72834.1 TonB-dependent siderophore receptor [Hansschlegelia zhihuaiae]
MSRFDAAQARAFARPAVLLISAFAAASPTIAQEQSPDGGGTLLEEIAVEGEGRGAASGDGGETRRLERRTEAASRLGLTVRETAATVDVITQERIQSEGLRSLIEVYGAAPGVTAGNLPGEPGVTAMRGFSRGAVGYSVDGFRAIDPLLASRNYDAYSFERIEILKGPASVVGGSGALAGTINLVTRKPELGVNKGDGLISYGSFDGIRAGASFNAAISENAAANASVLHSRSDGFVHDTDSERTQVTTGVLLQPSDRFKVTAAFDYFEDDFSTAYFGAPLIGRDYARNPSGVASGWDPVLGDLVLDKSMRKENYNVRDGVMKSDAYWARTTAEFALTDQWTLKNELGYYDADRRWANSEDYTFNPTASEAAGRPILDRSSTLITHDQQVFSNRTSANFDGEVDGMRNRFAAGVEYVRTDFGSIRRFGTTTAVDAFDPDRGEFPDDGFTTRQNFDSRVDNLALFAEDAINVTPNWIVVGGLRWDKIKLDRTIVDLDAEPGEEPDRFGNEFTNTSWRLGTVYEVAPGVSLFGQYTTAIAPVSSLLLINNQRTDFKLSTGRSVEAGVKASLFDGRAVATASVYQIEQDDILTRDPTDVNATIQGGKQRSRGVEFDIAVDVTDRWKVMANAAFVKAEFIELEEQELRSNGLPKRKPVSRAGNRPLNVPAQTFNLWTTYRFESLPLTIGAGVRYVGDFYTNNANTIRVKDRTLFDASVSYEVHQGGTVTLRGRNLTDELYAEWSGYSDKQVYLGAPRSFDLTYAVKF